MPRTPSDDDAALRWDDVDDPSWVDTQSGARRGGAGIGAEAGADGSDDRHREIGAPAHPSAGSLATRLVTGAGAVLYLAYSIAWIVGVGGLQLSGPTLVLEVVYQFAEFLAIIASALWFGATLVLTAGHIGRRAGWLSLGALVLLPWPFVLGVLA
ncbi:MAG: hypothetical protein RJQ01_11510 [Microcella sp.]|uniref:hypothetical protein n=1 Tax=Microcella sp. TaxID=1913979 RepID=UPI003314DF6F